MRALVSTTLLALVLTVLGACGDNAPAAPAPAPKPKRAAPAAAAGAADGGELGEAPQYVYAYNPVGKRDPFRAETETPRNPGEAGPVGTGTCSEPLCQYDLEQLNLVGVVSGDANPIAMLETPDHVGHIVRRNSRVGKQGGKVSAISRDCIVVTEFFQTPDGRVNPNKVNICVKKDEAFEKTIDLLNNKAVE